MTAVRRTAALTLGGALALALWVAASPPATSTRAPAATPTVASR